MTILIHGYKLVMTCSACPEQYNVFDNEGKQVAYLRLRHGWFRADVPTCGEKTIYESYPKGDGAFEPEERQEQLTKAILAVQSYYMNSEDYFGDYE